MKTRTEKIEKISRTVENIKHQMFRDRISLDRCMDDAGLRYKKVPYGCRNELMGDYLSWDEFKVGGSWGTRDGHYLFRTKIIIPEIFRGKEVFFFLSTGAEDIWNTDNPQMLVYINGKRRCGMDMNHNSVSIFDKEDWEKKTETVVDIAIYAYSNLAENENLLNMEIATPDEAAIAAYFDMSVPFDAAKAMLDFDSRKNAIDLLNDKASLGEISPVDEEHANIIIDMLYYACDILKVKSEGEGKKDSKNGNDNCVTYSESTLFALSSYLDDHLYGAESSVTVASVGHTHIDVAWKWPVRQTREKVIRSYSTVIELMKRYPEYIFMASTPQMYEFVREEEPELFEEILERVKEGRFEPEGAMWLEADCNLTGGESLVRQILYGKRYFKETFGVDSDILWLPDVFGYSASMPQILLKSGVRAFVTTKLAWNDTNRMPHDLFMWQGIDGSTIPTYIITTCDLPRADLVMKKGGILNYTYNGRQDGSQIMGTWRAFREKDITNEVLTCYGFGDGGGGPTWEMLESDRRLRRGIPGVPRTVQKTVSAFMDGLLDKAGDNPDVPVWDDELYLEFHRGTYTSIGKNKRYNRKLEMLLGEVETVRTWAYLATGLYYPRKVLLDIWKVLMLNQFHDILPGSSIEEVYQVSEEEYKNAIDKVKNLIDDGVNGLRERLEEGIRSDIECINNVSKAELHCTKAEFDAISVTQSAGCIEIETTYFRISFDKNGEIVGLYDKEVQREVRDLGSAPLNRLIAFKDVPKEYDAWNIDADFEDTSWDITDVRELKLSSHCDEVHVDIIRAFRASKIHQSIVIRNDSRRIDFRTNADWHEHQILLKAAFPVNVDSGEINCEIQYGNIKRNLRRDNSWDKAKFECCAHRWMDISDERSEYGVAILNDCKYGYDAKENLMRLTLIKSGIFPNPNADQGEHEFTYSLFPHKGDFRKGEVIREAEELNRQQHFYLSGVEPASSNHYGYVASKFVRNVENSIIELDKENGVYIGAVKMAEESDDVIIRLYEGHGQETEAGALVLKGLLQNNCEKGNVEISECDLLENALKDAEVISCRYGEKVQLHFNPYEIKTLRIAIKTET